MDKELVAEIDVETITYTRIGGYKATPYISTLRLPSTITAKSIKGVWRWWARAAVVGACRGSITYKEANEYLNKLLGGARENEGISLYRLEVISERPPMLNSLENLMKEIDDFYKSAKEFMKQYSNKIREDKYKDVKVKVCINPSNPRIIVEHEKHNITGLKDKIENIVKNSPLKNYFHKIEVEKNGKRITVYLMVKDDDLKNYVLIPRVKLLLMRRHEEEDEIIDKSDSNKVERYLNRVKEELIASRTKGWRFKVLLYSNGERESDDFALSTLVLSLILGGIGSITRRGLGSLRIKSIRIGGEAKVEQSLIDIIKKLSVEVRQGGEQHEKPARSNLNEKELERALKELSQIAVKNAEKIFKIECLHKDSATDHVPLVPSLHQDQFNIEVIECNPDLVRIGEVFLKQRWKATMYAKGGSIHTWILGLPRFQKSYGVYTGYGIKTNKEYDPKRRISAIGIRIFCSSENKHFAIMYGFLSEDWPLGLIHVGRRRNHKPIETPVISRDHNEAVRSIKYAYNNAWRKVSELIRESCQNR